MERKTDSKLSENRKIIDNQDASRDKIRMKNRIYYAVITSIHGKYKKLGLLENMTGINTILSAENIRSIEPLERLKE